MGAEGVPYYEIDEQYYFSKIHQDFRQGTVSESVLYLGTKELKPSGCPK